jgi:hypothetical protein
MFLVLLEQLQFLLTHTLAELMSDMFRLAELLTLIFVVTALGQTPVQNFHSMLPPTPGPDSP